MKTLAVFALLLMFWGCSPGYYQQGMRSADDGRFDQASDQFYREIQDHPDSYKAWRELGVACYRTGDYAKALGALQQSDQIRPDARTQLFLGLIHEKNEDYDLALRAYRRAVELKPRGDTGQKVRAHLDALVQKQIRKEIQAAMAVEESLPLDSIPENTICVAGFDLPEDLAFLRAGLAEFTAIDLGKVQALRVVERRKIAELLRELQLQQTDLVDEGTRLRVGKLVGSRNVVTGSMQKFGDDEIELFGAAHDVVSAETSFTEPAAGTLEEFFRVQKAFVFRLIDSLGLVLSPAERAAIEAVPTESYLALLAYCRGMDYLERGDYQQAADEFKEAAGTDKSFSEAQTQAEVVGDVVAVSAEYDVGSPLVVEAAAVNLSLELGDQEFLSSLITNSGFLPSLLDGTLDGELANLPDTGTVTSVSVTVRGEIDVAQ